MTHWHSNFSALMYSVFLSPFYIKKQRKRTKYGEVSLSLFSVNVTFTHSTGEKYITYFTLIAFNAITFYMLLL